MLQLSCHLHIGTIPFHFTYLNQMTWTKCPSSVRMLDPIHTLALSKHSSLASYLTIQSFYISYDLEESKEAVLDCLNRAIFLISSISTLLALARKHYRFFFFPCSSHIRIMPIMSPVFTWVLTSQTPLPSPLHQQVAPPPSWFIIITFLLPLFYLVLASYRKTFGFPFLKRKKTKRKTLASLFTDNATQANWDWKFKKNVKVWQIWHPLNYANRG